MLYHIYNLMTLFAGMFASGFAVGDPQATGSIEPGAIDYYVVEFDEHQTPHVEVLGMDGGDLDSFVVDGFLRLVSRDAQSDDLCELAWNQPRAGQVFVIVRNMGASTDRYSLSTNGRLVMARSASESDAATTPIAALQP